MLIRQCGKLTYFLFCAII